MKSNITISLDSEVVMKLREEGINISKFINDWLQSYLDTPKKEEEAHIHKEIEYRKEKNDLAIKMAEVSKKIRAIEKERKDNIIIDVK